jgi:hypothetical protein
MKSYTSPDGTGFINITDRPDGSKHIERIEMTTAIYHNAVEYPNGTRTVEYIERHTVGGGQYGVVFSKDGGMTVEKTVMPDGTVLDANGQVVERPTIH